VSNRLRDSGLDLAFEPGRWLVATAGVLVAEVLWIKERDGRRFVVLAAGMNDFLRPALYGARHRIVAVHPRSGPVSAAAVVGPVCESADVFDPSALLPPLEPGDLLADPGRGRVWREHGVSLQWTATSARAGRPRRPSGSGSFRPAGDLTLTTAVPLSLEGSS
jgi:hypothetical protein